jgi:hypothetical protein
MAQTMEKEDIQRQISMQHTDYYMVHVVGKQSPIKLHSNQLSAELEAERLAKSERREVFVFKAISKFELKDVVKIDLTK